MATKVNKNAAARALQQIQGKSLPSTKKIDLINREKPATEPVASTTPTPPSEPGVVSKTTDKISNVWGKAKKFTTEKVVPTVKKSLKETIIPTIKEVPSTYVKLTKENWTNPKQSLKNAQAMTKGLYESGVELASDTARLGVNLRPFDKQNKQRDLALLENVTKKAKSITGDESKMTSNEKAFKKGFKLAGDIAPYIAGEGALTKSLTKVGTKPGFIANAIGDAASSIAIGQARYKKEDGGLSRKQSALLDVGMGVGTAGLGKLLGMPAAKREAKQLAQQKIENTAKIEADRLAKEEADRLIAQESAPRGGAPRGVNEPITVPMRKTVLPKYGPQRKVSDITKVNTFQRLKTQSPVSDITNVVKRSENVPVNLHPDELPAHIEKATPELKASIAQKGIDQPVILSADGRHIIDGEKRVAAAREMGITNVPTIKVKSTDTPQQIKVRIMENEAKYHPETIPTVTKAEREANSTISDLEKRAKQLKEYVDGSSYGGYTALKEEQQLKDVNNQIRKMITPKQAELPIYAKQKTADVQTPVKKTEVVKDIAWHENKIKEIKARPKKFGIDNAPVINTYKKKIQELQTKNPEAGFIDFGAMTDSVKGMFKKKTPSSNAVKQITEVPVRKTISLTKRADMIYGTGKQVASESNLDRLGLNTKAMDELNSHIKKTDMATHRVQPHSDVEKLAMDTAQNPKKMVEIVGSRNTLSGEERLALGNAINTMAGDLEDATLKLNSGTLSSDAADILSRKTDALEQQLNSYVDRYIKAGTDQGRALAANRIMAQRTLDPVYWMSRAKKELGRLGDLSHLSGKHIDAINDLINKGDKEGLAVYMTGLRDSTFAEKVVTLWKAGLLTGPQTHLANLTGNASMQALEGTKKYVAATLDRAASVFTGKRTTFTGNADMLKKFGNPPVFDEIMKANKTQDLAKRVNFLSGSKEHGKVMTGLGKAAQAYTNGIFGALEASDRIFFGNALRKSAFNEAYAAAYNEAKALGKSTKAADMEKRVKYFYENPDDDMLLQAISSAEYATFKKQNVLSRAAASPKLLFAGKTDPLSQAGYALTEMVMPFTKTPSNIAISIMDYSPVGIINTLVKAATEKGGQKALVDGLARNITGSGVMALGAMLASNGMITGNKPSDPQEAEMWDTQGKQPRSLKIPGSAFDDKKTRYVSLDRLQPLGNIMVMGAAVAQRMAGYDEKKGMIGLSGDIAGDFKNSLLEQTFLKGMSGALEALTDKSGGTAAQRWLGNAAGSIIPAFVANLARATDPYKRKPETPKEYMMARLPYVSDKLLPRRDVFGRRLQYERPGGADSAKGAVFQAFNPFYYSTEASPEVKNMIEVLQKTGHKTSEVQNKITLPKKQSGGMTEEQRTIKLKPADFDELLKVTGNWKKAAFIEASKTPAFLEADQVDQQEELKKLESQIEKQSKELILELMRRGQLPSQKKK